MPTPDAKRARPISLFSSLRRVALSPLRRVGLDPGRALRNAEPAVEQTESAGPDHRGDPTRRTAGR
jgi:hypothetical protein